MVSRLMKVDIMLRICSGLRYSLVSYVNGLRTPRNNASANALVNDDILTYCVVYTSWLIIGMIWRRIFCLQV